MNFRFFLHYFLIVDRRGISCVVGIGMRIMRGGGSVSPFRINRCPEILTMKKFFKNYKKFAKKTFKLRYTAFFPTSRSFHKREKIRKKDVQKPFEPLMANLFHFNLIVPLPAKLAYPRHSHNVMRQKIAEGDLCGLLL